MAKKRMAKTAPWKDRIRELRRVPASSLVRHPKNPRQHPESQKAAMQAMLKRVGYADALLVREDADGALHLIDGEMRSEIAADAEVPVLVLDVTEEEADYLLATLDPVTSLAEVDAAREATLIQELRDMGGQDDVLDLIAHIFEGWKNAESRWWKHRRRFRKAALDILGCMCGPG